MTAAVEAYAEDGEHVVIVTDPVTARHLALAWEFAHRVAGGFTAASHPGFLMDCVSIQCAAAQSLDVQPVLALDQRVAPVRLLRVVGGEES